MILAAFERTYRANYDSDFGRSEDYKMVKKEIIELIEKYAVTQSGKAKKYATDIKKTVINRGTSFGDNLHRALIDHKDIMKPFVERKYNGEYENIIEEIGMRMREVRNGIAHDKLDWHFDAIHLCDIRIVEELIYAMVLSDINLNTECIQKAINNLFDERFAI